ncbi:MAG: hypothetical protein LBI05_04180 [Planctomycetaceae bacterium]|nr:hypothetical protein [Planctomycetaceae bacterium]
MSKSKGQFGFFDLETQLDKIYQINDFLPKLNAIIDWEIFRKPKRCLMQEKRYGRTTMKQYENCVLHR